MADEILQRRRTAMSDENVIEEPTTDVEEAAPQGDGEPTTDWKAEARKWEKRAKESLGYKDAADKWADYEKSLKPEQERIAEELAAAREEAKSARTALLRYEVAAEKNVPADAIKLLNGSTREELEEAADTLLALVANQSKPKSPQPDLSQGRPASGTASSAASQFADAIGDLL